MAEQNALTYNATALITSTKSFRVTTPEGAVLYDNEITSLIDIYFLRISFIPSDLSAI